MASLGTVGRTRGRIIAVPWRVAVIVGPVAALPGLVALVVVGVVAFVGIAAVVARWFIVGEAQLPASFRSNPSPHAAVSSAASKPHPASIVITSSHRMLTPSQRAEPSCQIIPGIGC